MCSAHTILWCSFLARQYPSLWHSICLHEYRGQTSTPCLLYLPVTPIGPQFFLSSPVSLSLSVSLVRFIGRFPSSPPGAFHTAPFRERLCLCSLCAHRNRDSRRAARWQTGRAERLSLWFSSDKESFTFDCRRSAKLNNRYRVPLQLVKAKAFVLTTR